MRARGVLRTTFVTTVATATLVLPAAAQEEGGSGYAWVDEDEDSVEVGAGDAEMDDPGVPGGSTSDCTWTPVPDSWWEDTQEPLTISEMETILEYWWYWKECPTPDGTTTEMVSVPRDPAPPADPTVLRDDARDRLEPPSPTIAMNPPGDALVHVETWLWIDSDIWRTHSRSASAGGVTSTVSATPERVVWDMGNGETVVCHGPGTRYDPSVPSDEQTTDCSYTYRHSSAGQPGEAYAVTATVYWDIQWTVVGASGGGPLEPMTTTGTTSLRVAEMQALNR